MNNWPRYHLLREDGERFTAEPMDYLYLPPGWKFLGTSLMRSQHPYVTNTGRIVYAPRLLKREPTLLDLQRLALPF